MRQSVSSATAYVRKHRPDYQVLLYMGLLVIIGLIVLFAISPARVQLINEGGGTLDQAHFMQKQLLYLAAGVIAFIVASRLPMSFWKKIAPLAMIAAIAACSLLALLGLFMDGGPIVKAGGATRWFNIGIGTFQPAELLKFAVLLFAAFFLAAKKRAGQIGDFHATIVPIWILAAVSALFIIVFQKDLGTGMTFFGMLFVMMILSGIRWKHLGATIGGGLAAVVLLVITSPHRIDRVATFFNPSGVDAASSYHINQAAIALGSGGLSGKGLGQSVQAFGYLPEAVNDSIFAIIGETFGFVGVVAVIALFVGLLYRLLRTSERTSDPASSLIVGGVFGLIFTHMVVNIGAMTGIVPLTGVTLPFLSFGGTSLVFTMVALGIAFNVSRFTSLEVAQSKGDASYENTGRRRGVRGSRDSGSRRYQRA